MDEKTYELLRRVRKSKTLSLKPNRILRKTIQTISGEEVPLRIRYYQAQGIFHMLSLPRMVLGDGTGLGKTLQTIVTFTYLWDTKESENKVIVVAPKSALGQWKSEIEKFTIGVSTLIARGTPKAREKIYKQFFESDQHVVLALNYHTLVRDWSAGATRPRLPNGALDPKAAPTPGLLDRYTMQHGKHLVVVFDECTAFKNTTTKTWDIASRLSKRSRRVYGLTATLLKNRLMEGFSIYKVIQPSVFTTKSAFMRDYCITRMQRVAGNRKIPIVVGYKNLEQFRQRIDPYFLGRPKHEVSDELPVLTTRSITFNLSKDEEAKYNEALEGILELGDGTTKDYSETKALTSLIYCQQTVNSLALLGFDDVSSKEQLLMDLLQEDLAEEKVIVYTRFASHVPRIKKLLAKVKIKAVSITGKEKGAARQKAQDKFQDMDSGVNVVIITDAGSEAINLQAAAAMIFIDSPWSWGNYVQIIGRMIRIGSPHKGVLVYHLIAKRSGGETIDGYVLKMLRKKKKLIDSVIGEAAIGSLEFESSQSDTKILMQALQMDHNINKAKGIT